MAVQTYNLAELEIKFAETEMILEKLKMYYRSSQWSSELHPRSGGSMRRYGCHACQSTQTEGHTDQCLVREVLIHDNSSGS